MSLIDVKAIQDQARKEIQQEVSETAVEKLKELYRKKEKAQLVVKNIDREIESYLNDVGENVVYASAGVDVRPR